MESYRPLYRIVVKHEYFEGKPCGFLQCGLSAQGKLLAARRGLLFHEVSANEWQILYDAAGAGVDTENDVLELGLRVKDPGFVQYTEWKDICPSAVYTLELPLSSEEKNAVAAIHRTDEKGKIGSSFCTIRLHLTEQLMKVAKAKTPETCILHFPARKVYWEYIFIPRDKDNSIPAGSLLLEDTTGKVIFRNLYKTQAYGREVWRTKSIKSIPVRSVYDCRLRLVVQPVEEGSSKHILLRQVKPPEYGQFQSRRADCLRQVCYY